MTNNIAVFGVFRNENKLFPHWFAYYGSLFGPENVYVYDDNSSDGTFRNKKKLPNYELLDLGRDKTVERYGVGDYNTLWNFIVNKYIELLERYEIVIHVDADDFIVVNPEKYENLKHFITEVPREWYRCSAYEVLQDKDESNIDWSKPLLDQRKHWIRVSNLDKTAITRRRLDLKGHSSWVVGNHYVCGSPNEKPTDDLLLIHLHRIDYKNYEKKYLVKDKTIKTNEQFYEKYKGYPLFWKKSDMDSYFYNDEINHQWGARRAARELIPEIYKEIL